MSTTQVGKWKRILLNLVGIPYMDYKPILLDVEEIEPTADDIKRTAKSLTYTSLMQTVEARIQILRTMLGEGTHLSIEDVRFMQGQIEELKGFVEYAEKVTEIAQYETDERKERGEPKNA